MRIRIVESVNTKQLHSSSDLHKENRLSPYTKWCLLHINAQQKTRQSTSYALMHTSIAANIIFDGISGFDMRKNVLFKPLACLSLSKEG